MPDWIEMQVFRLTSGWSEDELRAWLRYHHIDIDDLSIYFSILFFYNDAVYYQCRPAIQWVDPGCALNHRGLHRVRIEWLQRR